MELEEAFRRLRRNLATARERAEGAQLMRCAARVIKGKCAAGSRSHHSAHDVGTCGLSSKPSE